ncbi:hypothetical protein BW897_30045 [Bacillus cereus]|uniref:Uncharacterized protein n=1 Tax=Bacillus cereus TaxID=1396 RepID=A0A1S9TCF1_BACCE|nr:hypothetical protein BW897_30045 [Bacillus cereus]PEK86232.1 hypothetical protein CN600_29280 [Bacillus mycoides]QWG83841.1 hypothetical protein EXW61_10065 [Bacillus mycoides]
MAFLYIVTKRIAFFSLYKYNFFFSKKCGWSPSNTPEEKKEVESFNVQGVPYIIVKDHENNIQKSILGFSTQSLEEAIL